jgi:SLT domain-containing protein
MDTHEAMQDLFATYTNSQLQEMTAENYYTIASWRFKFNCNQLSMEKQISILTKLNYQPTQNLLWKKKQSNQCCGNRNMERKLRNDVQI